MTKRQSVFAEPHHEWMARLGEQIRRFGVERRLLSECSTALLSQPAHMVGRAESELRGLVQVGWSALSRPRPSLMHLLKGGSRTDSQQLRASPGLELFYAFHSDGHLREEALDRMTGPCRSPFEVAIILYRLNDWVPQVRRAAVCCAGRRLPKTPVKHLAAAWVGLADRMHLWARGHEEQQTVLASLIARQDIRDRIAAWIGQDYNGPVTAVFDQMLRRPEFDGDLAGWAASAHRPQVRARALKALLDGEASWISGYRREWIDKAYGIHRRTADIARRPLTVSPDRPALMMAAAVDRSPLVRRTTAAALVSNRHALPNWRIIADVLLMDSNPSIRERAEWVIAEMDMTSA